VNGHRGGVVVRISAVIVVNVAAFELLQGSFRHLEAWSSNAIVRLVAGPEHSFLASATSVGIIPGNGTPFTASVTPSCSALASVLALACLSTTTTKLSRHRRVTATLLAVSVITVGNVLRIASSIGVGVIAGRASLILFHDWVGGLLTFVYTMGGYILMLYVMLPSDSRRRQRKLEKSGRVAVVA
jgi:exosortase/archaeosortase family protein